MHLQTATLKDLIQYLLVNPDPTERETGDILLNLCQRLERLETQNQRQDAAIDGANYSLGQLWQRRYKARMRAAQRRSVT